ncbi:MAG: carboxypeptidase-like regulatory domain-containing protein, partial [Saprospiraceae bacterium]|nr:carboxypeptidase-like regulatory domain-containing protein [Saprospiraceae bacterium]
MGAINFLRFLLLSITMLVAFVTQAQEGTIRGTITDVETGEPLMFTSVFIKDTNPPFGAQTDLDGNYEIRIPEGSYTLEVSYIGYASKTITDVMVKENEVTILDFSMVEETEQLQEVIVQASRIDRTENALLILQRKATTIQDGISAQEISRFGSNNAAETMKRVTGASVVDGKYVFVRGLGDRYSSAQLNGLQLPSTDPYRNSMQLDLIPANVLDNVIASKTFTPDQPGNFTGGNVNLKTKAFPERFTLAASFSTSYNTLVTGTNNFLTHEGGQTDWLGYDDGTRSIPGILQDSNYINTITQSSAILARRDSGLAHLIDDGIRS